MTRDSVGAGNWRKRRIFAIVGAVVALFVVAAMIVLVPGSQKAPLSAAPIEPSEHVRTIEAIGAPKRDRPVIAIVALNEATEVTDLLVPFGVLRRADVADVTVVAERTAPVPLYPFSRLGLGPELLRIEPQSTMRAFDERHPDGADYIVVPALLPRDDPFVVDWITNQHRKGAKIVSVCAGSLTLAATGLLDGRRATTHWAYIDELQKAHPTMKRVQDRRYVSDNGITTATGITASMPTMVALVEAIAGRPKAHQVAKDLGMAHWDARHRSSAFKLTWEHRKTYIRNWLSLWRRETVGVPVREGVDEIALSLTVDAYSRTALSEAITVGSGTDAVRSKHGLMILPSTTAQAAAVDLMLPPPSSDAPARTIDRELAQIAARFDRPTADIVALTIEYPWTTEAGLMQR
jgi:transcriptional regulator GlxA family with amidase domain